MYGKCVVCLACFENILKVILGFLEIFGERKDVFGRENGIKCLVLFWGIGNGM